MPPGIDVRDASVTGPLSPEHPMPQPLLEQWRLTAGPHMARTAGHREAARRRSIGVESGTNRRHGEGRRGAAGA